ERNPHLRAILAGPGDPRAEPLAVAAVLDAIREIVRLVGEADPAFATLLHREYDWRHPVGLHVEAGGVPVDNDAHELERLDLAVAHRARHSDQHAAGRRQPRFLDAAPIIPAAPLALQPGQPG